MTPKKKMPAKTKGKVMTPKNAAAPKKSATRTKVNMYKSGGKAC